MQARFSAGIFFQRELNLFAAHFIIVNENVDVIFTRRLAGADLINTEIRLPLTGVVDIQQRRIEIIFGQNFLHANAQQGTSQCNKH